MSVTAGTLSQAAADWRLVASHFAIKKITQVRVFFFDSTSSVVT